MIPFLNMAIDFALATTMRKWAVSQKVQVSQQWHAACYWTHICPTHKQNIKKIRHVLFEKMWLSWPVSKTDTVHSWKSIMYHITPPPWFSKKTSNDSHYLQWFACKNVQSMPIPNTKTEHQWLEEFGELYSWRVLDRRFTLIHEFLANQNSHN